MSDFNLFDPKLWDDPFPTFARLRQSAPVLAIDQPGMSRKLFLVTRRDLIIHMLTHPEVFSSRFYEVFVGGSAPNPAAAAIYAQGWEEVDVMLTTDPPQHQRFRALANSAFSPRRIQAMQDKISQAVDELIDRFVERGECDFVEEFAVPLPIYMISDVLGIPRSIYRRFREWSDAYIVRNGQMGSPAAEVSAARLIVECQHFLHDLVQQRRRNPGEDLISDLVQARAAGEEPLNDLEILSIVQQLLIAGNETTRSSLIGMMARILDDTSQYEALMQDGALVPNAIEETFRYETPGAATWRIAREDVTLGGVDIGKGSIIMIRLDSANRDEAQFIDAERFDVRRSNAATHLTFGQGIHFCIGRALARREMNIAMPKLLQRLAHLEIIREQSDLRIHTSVHIRALRALHVRFAAGSRS